MISFRSLLVESSKLPFWISTSHNLNIILTELHKLGAEYLEFKDYIRVDSFPSYEDQDEFYDFLMGSNLKPRYDPPYFTEDYLTREQVEHFAAKCHLQFSQPFRLHSWLPRGLTAWYSPDNEWTNEGRTWVGLSDRKIFAFIDPYLHLRNFARTQSFPSTFDIIIYYASLNDLGKNSINPKKTRVRLHRHNMDLAYEGYTADRLGLLLILVRGRVQNSV